MAKLTIPPKDREALVSLFLINQEKKKAFLEIIKDPENVPHADDFAKHFADTTGMDRKEADKAIYILFNLYDLYDRSGKNIEIILKDIIDFLKDTDKKEIKEASAHQIDLFKTFLRKVLTLDDTLGIRAKAYRVMLQHQNIFRRSEIYSDIRSIFRPHRPDVKPSAAVIVHSLKIDYYEDYIRKAIYFGLSFNDLHQLKNTVERAIKKHESLKTVILDNIGIQCLEEEE